MKERVEQFVDSGRTGAIIDILNAVFSIASCMFYIVESYDKALLDKGYKTWLEAIQALEWIFVSWFCFDYLLRLYIATNRLEYMTSTQSFIDLITILPAFAQITEVGANSGVKSMSFARVFRLLRMLRLLRVGRLTDYAGTKADRVIYVTVLRGVTIIFLGTGIMHFAENLEDARTGRGGDICSDNYCQCSCGTFSPRPIISDELNETYKNTIDEAWRQGEGAVYNEIYPSELRLDIDFDDLKVEELLDNTKHPITSSLAYLEATNGKFDKIPARCGDQFGCTPLQEKKRAKMDRLQSFLRNGTTLHRPQEFVAGACGASNKDCFTRTCDLYESGDGTLTPVEGKVPDLNETTRYSEKENDWINKSNDYNEDKYQGIVSNSAFCGRLWPESTNIVDADPLEARPHSMPDMIVDSERKTKPRTVKSRMESLWNNIFQGWGVVGDRQLASLASYESIDTTCNTWRHQIDGELLSPRYIFNTKIEKEVSRIKANPSNYVHDFMSDIMNFEPDVIEQLEICKCLMSFKHGAVDYTDRRFRKGEIFVDSSKSHCRSHAPKNSRWNWNQGAGREGATDECDNTDACKAAGICRFPFDETHRHQAVWEYCSAVAAKSVCEIYTQGDTALKSGEGFSDWGEGTDQYLRDVYWQDVKNKDKQTNDTKIKRLTPMNQCLIQKLEEFYRRYLGVEDQSDQYYNQLTLGMCVQHCVDKCEIYQLDSGCSLNFDDMLYFIVVTLSTVGYGDISPSTVFSRLVGMGIIVYFLIMVPLTANEITEQLSLRSKYARAKYEGRHMHVIITGDVSSQSIVAFFSELFHTDHGDDSDLQAVILCDTATPPEFVNELLNDISYVHCLSYLQGSPFNFNDLKRAKLERAQACFCLTNKFTNDVDEEDAQTVLTVMSIKKYVEDMYNDDPDGGHCKPHVPVLVQLIRPENAHPLQHLSDDAIALHSEGQQDHIICIDKLKMNMLAKASDCPGISTMLCNLVTSSGMIDDISQLPNFRWLREYITGNDVEIYRCEMASAYVGCPFAEAAYELFFECGVVLFALEVMPKGVKGTRMKPAVILNPKNFVIPKPKRSRPNHGYFIAPNKAFADWASLRPEVARFDREGKEALSKRMKECARRYRQTMESLRHETPSHGPEEGVRDVTVEDVGDGEGTGEDLDPDSAIDGASAFIDSDDDTIDDFYVFPKGCEVDIFEASIRSVDIDLPNLSEHIIVCGNVTNLYHFVRTLRRRTIGIPRPIIILFHDTHDTTVLEDAWRKIQHFVELYIVQGSPLEAGDLRRAGIARCKKVVILAKPHATSKRGQTNIEALVDADTIFTHKVVMRELDHARSVAKTPEQSSKVANASDVVTEILLHSNIPYVRSDEQTSSRGVARRHTGQSGPPAMESSGGMQGTHHFFSEQFASGHVYTSAMIDTLVCQAFFNESIVDVLELLVAADSAKAVRDEAMRLQKGNQLTPDEVLPECSHVYNIPVFIEDRKRGSPDDPDGITTYGDLFKVLACDTVPPMIPLGLYRMPHQSLQNTLPYVFTNPPEDLKLLESDRVFVLSPYNEDKQQRHLMEHKNELDVEGLDRGDGRARTSSAADSIPRPMAGIGFSSAPNANASMATAGLERELGRRHREVTAEIAALRREVHQSRRMDMAVNTSELINALRQVGAQRLGRTPYD